MARVLFVSYDGMTDPLGQSQVIPYLRGLSAKGHEITILSCEKHHNYNRNRELIENILRENKIRWVTVFYRKNPPVLSTVLDIRELKREANQLFAERKFDIVHCRSYISAFIGLWAKKKFGSKFLFDIRGFWADERVDGELWNLKNPLYKFIYKYFKLKEIEFFSRADYSISLTFKARDIIHSWNRIQNQPIPIEVIPCCVDTDLFDSEKISSEELDLLRNEFGISKNDFVLSYVGSVGTWYLLDKMLAFFVRLKQKKGNARFLFITPEPADYIFDHAARYGLTNQEIIITEAKRNEVPAFLKLSAASVFFIKPAFSKAASSPTKQGEIMSLGIPIICNKGIGDTDLIIRKYEAGTIVNEFNEQEYDRAVSEIDKFSTDAAIRIRKGAEEFYALEKGVAQYESVYLKLMNS